MQILRTKEKEKFIDDLMSKMTLEEKAGQMNQYNGFWDATGPMPEGDYQKRGMQN